MDAFSQRERYTPFPEFQLVKVLAASVPENINGDATWGAFFRRTFAISLPVQPTVATTDLVELPPLTTTDSACKCSDRERSGWGEGCILRKYRAAAFVNIENPVAPGGIEP